jgi:hypothetical protein
VNPHGSSVGVGHDTDIPAKEAVDILYGVEETTNAIVKFIDKTEHRYNVYADSKTPSFVMNNEDIRTKFFEFKNKKGGYIRYITEITKENIDYCKQLMKVVDLRHIEGPRGVFRVNETEYHYNAVLDESRQVAVIIRSNLKQVVAQQQTVFDILWDKAVPAQDTIREIEDEQSKEQRLEEVEEESIKGNPTIMTNSIKTSTANVADPVLKIIEQQRIEKEEEKQKEIRDQLITDGQNSDYHPPCSRKIQLWSNASTSEYALRLDGESGFLAATNEDKPMTQYTDLLEEVDYLEDLKYDWNYSLKQWISGHHYNNNIKTYDGEKTPTSYSLTASTTNSVYDEKLDNAIKFDQDQHLKNNGKNRYENNENNKISKHVGYKEIPPFKCHFCKLVFGGSIKRKKHEQAWHS